MDLISDRRALHRIPELDRDLPETLGYLRSVLEPLPCRQKAPYAPSLILDRITAWPFGRIWTPCQ